MNRTITPTEVLSDFKAMKDIFSNNPAFEAMVKAYVSHPENYGSNLVVGANFISLGANTTDGGHVSKFLMPFYELVRKFEDQSKSPNFPIGSMMPKETVLEALFLSHKYEDVVNMQLGQLVRVADEVTSSDL